MPSPHLLCELCLLRPRIPQALEMSSCPLGICPIGTSARHQTISLGCHASPPNLCTSKSYPPFKAPDPGMPHLFWEAFLDLFSHSHHLFFPSYSKCYLTSVYLESESRGPVPCLGEVPSSVLQQGPYISLTECLSLTLCWSRLADHWPPPLG